jgi:hypothetical protein
MKQTTTSLPWWRTEAYDQDNWVSPKFDHDWAGPKGLALVRAWPDGRTDAGWGLMGKDGADGFMPRYLRGEFNERRVVYGYEKGKHTFAFVMRSTRLVCIDIDGKNGGLEHAKRLGLLPPTMAETSKSGDGYHLFYLVDEEWDDEKGYGLLSDRIGIEQGVDIRATGCVYHHPQQRWNLRSPAPLPGHLLTLLQHRDQKVAATTARINTVLASNDDMEVLMMQDEMVSELAKPIPAGKRNNTLFAIGSQMMLAQVPDWETALRDRANQVGLDAGEVDKLVANISRYGTQQP